MRVLRGLRRYRTLSPAERRLFVRAYVSLAAVEIVLRALGFRRLLQRVPRGVAPSNQPVGHDALDRARQYARWIASASRHHVVRARCLHRSVVLQQWLRSDGVPSELRIGVRKEGSRLKGHAWVELDGYVLDDQVGSVAGYTRLVGLSEHSLTSSPTFSRPDLSTHQTSAR